MEDLIIGKLGMTGKEYADGKMPELLEGPKKQEYVVLVAMIVDTAIIPAYSEREAAEMYMFPADLETKDCALWAMTRAEFEEMVKPAAVDAREPAAE
jgi:hypothetical protein